MTSKLKSKLILGVSIIVWIISGAALLTFFEEVGVSTVSYYIGEESMSYASIYSMIISIMLAVEVHSRLSGNSPNNTSTYRATWSHWFFGSTAWIVIIYLIELINIRPSFIEFLIEAIASLALVLFFYKHWTSKVEMINLERKLETDKNKEEDHKESRLAWMDKARQALNMTPEEQKKLIEEHTFEEMEREEQARKQD